MNIDEWYHVTATYQHLGVNDLTGINFYLNGQEITDFTPIQNGTFTGINPDSNQPLRIGAGSTSGSVDHFFTGLIDEVFVKSSVLSAADIADLYQAGLASLRAGHVNDLDYSFLANESPKAAVATENIEDSTASKAYVVDTAYLTEDSGQARMTGVLAEWDFETSSGTTAFDMSGNAHSATIYGDTAFTAD